LKGDEMERKNSSIKKVKGKMITFNSIKIVFNSITCPLIGPFKGLKWSSMSNYFKILWEKFSTMF